MAGGVSTRTLRTLVFVAVVLFAFWRPLFAGGTLAPDDQLWSAAPFSSDAPTDLSIEVAEPDASAIHSAWTRWADEAREGTLTQLGDGRSGAPTLADGVPLTHLLYLVVPGWFAPGVVAAVAMLVAMFGMARFAERTRVTVESATFAGLAFGLSGLLFSWYGWPHATAFALVPWVLAATADVVDTAERRDIARLAGATAVLAWCGVWAVTAFTMIGVVAVVATRVRHRGSVIASVAGLLTGLALAAPHLLASASRWSWADTSGREALGDTSASLGSVITVAFGSLWGDDAAGFPWIGSSSAQLSVGFVGLVVVVFAALALRQGGAGLNLPLALAAAGFGFAYVGGPFAAADDLVIGSGGEPTHARVLLTLGLVLLAARGISSVQSEAPAGSGAWDRRSIITLGVVAVVSGIAVVRWLDAARSEGAVRAALAESVGSLLAAGVAVAIVVAWRRRVVAPAAVVLAASTLVVFELLSFGMAVPTVTDRHERLVATEAHTGLDDLVGDGALIVADGRAFPPATSARFGPDDVRVPRPRSAAEIALLTEVDTGAVRGGATVEQPRLSTLDDPNGAWTRLGVDALVVSPGRRPPGPTTLEVAAAAERVDPAGGQFSAIVSLDSGLRAVELDLEAPFATPVQVDVSVAGRLVFGDAAVVTGSPVVVPVAGDSLAEAEAVITIRVAAEPGTSTLGVGPDGAPVIGVVGGSDTGELVIVDGLAIVHRPTPAITDTGGADVTIESMDDRSLVALIDAEAPVDIWTDIVDRPGWTVTIDGAAGYLARDAVLGAGVPAGSHRVAFSYVPPGLVSGLTVIAAAAVVWLLIGPVLGRRRSPKAEVTAGSVRSRD